MRRFDSYERTGATNSGFFASHTGKTDLPDKLYSYWLVFGIVNCVSIHYEPCVDGY